MLYDPAARTYYLKGGTAWLSAAQVAGPWKDAEKVPEAIAALEAKAKESAKGEAAPQQVEAQAGKMPEIVVSTTPAELLVTEGEPQYTPIGGTSLLYVSNTEDNILMDTGTQEYYVLISGRWFKSKSLPEGPWSYVAPEKLPADFAKIPPALPKGFLLVSVAGTSQAREAVLENSIPQTAAIDRKKATTEVKYAGPPKFAKIDNTDLEYAENTGTAVFKEGTKYYALDQGVWYEADSPNGPWKVCVSPPQQVNQIPPSNPHYNAKYVKVYEATDDTAYVGYTPGYTGSYVDNSTVVYGTGYQYPGYSSADAYIPPPATYGYSAAYDPYAGCWGYQPSYYSPSSWLAPSLVGFGLGMAVGALTSPYWGGGWWGPGGYNYTNININHNYIYHHNWDPDHRWNPDHHWPHPIYHPVVKPGERPGGRPGERGGPMPQAGTRPNIYQRPGNEKLLASRPATRLAAGPERPGARAERPAQMAKAGTPPARPARRSSPGPEPPQPSSRGAPAAA